MMPMGENFGRVASPNRLSSTTTPANAVDGPTGFDPARFKPRSYDGKPRWLSKEHKAVLQSFLRLIDDKLAAQTDADLNDLADACCSVSQINCGWDEYSVAELLFWRASALATEAGTATDREAGMAEGEGAGLEEATPNHSPNSDPSQGANQS